MKTLFVLTCTLLFSFTLLAQQQAQGGLKVGEVAPEFTGTDLSGNPLSLKNLTKEGPVVLIFYRGAWCPYCNKYMSQLQESLPQFTEKGARVIAITPETMESAEKAVEKTSATFTVITDSERKIMKDYKVLYTVPENVLGALEGYGINLTESNGKNDNVLPVPATYVIGKDGKVKFVHYDENYKQRASVEEIIANL
ncbi:peroxiredoxin-like family protein [Cytophagales bacterium LB-30]|uniref:thioredoxin-dependent peroxiredoxin n=1 Tax=Shiella aurantiaca TaxID=3058365 RepID=A0ABT8F6R5_9BACT|nr:peroxiredoxin-like family protein [Shiella aurantiaca]MDN4166183.1 peroxiredoxin-like family protein [Shiella aurantiaca]